MTGRDRMVVAVLAALAILAAGWILAVSPERKKAGEVESKVQSAQASLAAANAKLSEAKDAQSRYASAYATIVSLGEAVPADQQVPSLVYELDHASGHDHVEFQAINAGGSSSKASLSTATGAESSGGFQELPFTFTFTGSFFDLYHLMDKLQGFTVSLHSGGVAVKGRLLTIDGMSLTPGGSSGEAAGGSTLTGTVTATAYVLPTGQGLTAGATPTGPAGTTATSNSSSSGNPSAPAVVKAP